MFKSGWLRRGISVAMLLAAGACGAREGRAADAVPQGATRVRTIEVREPAGLERKAWPVFASLTVSPGDAADPAGRWVLVQDAGSGQTKAVPFQVLTALTPTYVALPEPAGKAASAPRPSLVKTPPPRDDVRLVEIVFLADLPAEGSARYLLYRIPSGAAKVEPPAPAVKLAYTGEGLGVTVDAGPAVFRFHPACGQFMSYVPKLAGSNEELGFKQYDQRPVHWNPDVYAKPQPWGHTSDWDIGKPDRKFEFLAARGPVAYRTVRYGAMPTSNGVFASVTYTAVAGMPFLLESSMMQFTEDTRVNAVRANELVFNRGLHTHAAWRDEKGQTHTVLCYDPAEPKRFREIVAKMGPDIPWIGLYNQQKGYGIGNVSLSRLDYSPTALAGPQSDRAYYYVNDYGEHGTEPPGYDMNFLYICRPQVYRRTVVPKGTIFAEHSAILVFSSQQDKDGRFTNVEPWVKLLQNPVEVEVK